MEAAGDARGEQIRLPVHVLRRRDRALAEARRRLAHDLLAERDDLVVGGEHLLESVDRREVADRRAAQRVGNARGLRRHDVALELERLALARGASPVERSPLHLDASDPVRLRAGAQHVEPGLPTPPRANAETRGFACAPSTSAWRASTLARALEPRELGTRAASIRSRARSATRARGREGDRRVVRSATPVRSASTRERRVAVGEQLHVVLPAPQQLGAQ